ncbi:hypothetical protein BG004_000741 [Podila humilis]|nr:hypothetical protein BG004_000741 [Podila humilis]
MTNKELNCSNQSMSTTDVVAINEDLREAAGLVNSLLVTLEPILIDHGRDLSAALKKLIRRDQNSEHTFAEWDSALRKPFEQLLVYDEWLQRIDPQSKFSANYRSHISGLTYKVKMVTEVNQNPRNVLRRLSTMAKGVIKRRASVQILSMPVPETPTTPTTPHSYSTTEALVMASNATESPNGIPSTPVSASSSTSSFIPCLPPLPQAVETLAIAENVSPQTASELPSLQSQVFLEEETHEYEVDTSPCADKIPKTVEENVLDTGSIDRVEKPLPLTPEMPAHHSLLSVQPKPQQLQHKYSSESELSSAGTLMTMAAPSSSACSSAASIRSKYSTADTVFTPSRDTSFARQQFLKERDARKATLRVGTHELIQAKAESLQSPTFKSRTPSSADSVRAGMDPRTKDKKPPVKSLISFWEQVSDPLEA